MVQVGGLLKLLGELLCLLPTTSIQQPRQSYKGSVLNSWTGRCLGTCYKYLTIDTKNVLGP